MIKDTKTGISWQASHFLIPLPSTRRRFPCRTIKYSEWIKYCGRARKSTETDDHTWWLYQEEEIQQNWLIDILFPIRVDIMLYSTQYQPQTLRKMINSMRLGGMANSVYKRVVWAFTVKSISGEYCDFNFETWLLTKLPDSSSGLVSSGNKPLPEPMLTQFYIIIWCH